MWYLTVERCNSGKRGVFAQSDGTVISDETQHTQEKMMEFLCGFGIILNPKSIELTDEEIKEYNTFYPLPEFNEHYGIVLKD